METIVKDRLLDLEELCKIVPVKMSSVYRNPELRAMRIKIGAKTFWSEVAIYAWIAGKRNEVTPAK
jgi:predicted DNA-binding transcriptional regulator AlpA